MRDRYLLPCFHRAVLCAFVIGALTCVAQALTFDLAYGQRKCFSEDLPPLTTVRGDVQVASGRGEMRLDLFVSDAKGVVAFHKSDVNMVKYSFQTASYDRHTTSPYRFCIVNQVHARAANDGDLSRRVTMKVDVLHKSRAEQFSRLATKGHVSKIQESFQSVSDDVDRLIEVMDELRAKEQELTDLNASTTRTIVRISVVACLFTIATGVANFVSLKSFFKQKKLV